MTSVSSPYAVFRATDWSSAVASPIGIGQCIRLKPKKYYPKNGFHRKKVGNISKKESLKKHVQLAFA